MVSGGVDWGWTWGSRRSLPSVTILRFHATFLPQPDAGRSTACSYRIALRAGSGQQPLDGNAGAELRDLTARCSLGGSGPCLGNGLPAPPDADVRVKAGRRLAFRCCPTAASPAPSQPHHPVALRWFSFVCNSSQPSTELAPSPRAVLNHVGISLASP